MAIEPAAVPPPARAVKRPLSPLKVALYRMLFPVGFLMFAAGFAGLFVIQDPERTWWISQCWFGDFWRALHAFNPVCNGFFFNGGWIAMLVSATSLRDHRHSLKNGIEFMDAATLRREIAKQDAANNAAAKTGKKRR
ncbi:hypothetical protein WJX74_004850 [Apatococcus lobatus]|uniref:Uncharacterized protein n=1 Tax=Apatococcus lobatus TaxID=904363 RepID=A0AAW1RD44_9CHLO